METTIIYVFLVLIVGIVAIRYLELRDLVRAIGKQTDALLMYLSEQHQSRIETASGLKRVEDATTRTEHKVDRLLHLLLQFDRRKSGRLPIEEDA